MKRLARKRSRTKNGLEEQALAHLRRNGATSVPDLFDALRTKKPSLTEEQATDLVWCLAQQGKAILEDEPPLTKSLPEYIRLWERNLWLYVTLTVSFATVIVICALPVTSPLVAARWILGSLFVLFIPGYVAVEALFAKRQDLDGIERFALSIGLSLVLVPLIGVFLNYTPWGIRPTPVLISMIILTVGLAAVALGRRYKMSAARSEELTWHE